MGLFKSETKIRNIKIKPVSNISNDCIVCVYRSMMRFCCLLGTSTIFCSCDHSKKNCSQKFTTSFFFYILLLIDLIVLFYYIILNIWTLNENEKTHVLPILVLTVLELAVIGNVITIIVDAQKRTRELNSIVAILNNKHNYGLEKVFSKKNQ